MKNVFITGASGYIGGKLARALEENESVELLMGLDIAEPVEPFQKLKLIKQDIRESLGGLFKQHAIDTVVHTAWVLEQSLDVAETEDINKSGTMNVQNACAETGVSSLLYTSSTTAYGFHPDNPIPLTEESPLRGNEDFTYGKNKREIEAVFKKFIAEHPDIAVTIIRPCFVVGPGFNNGMSEYLTSSRVILPSKTAPMQFVHEDDLVRALLYCLENSVSGVYNIAGAGEMTFDEMVAMQGNKLTRMPNFLLNGLLTMTRLLKGEVTSSSSLNMTHYPWIASREKFIDQTGFEYQFDTHSAFKNFVDYLQKQESR